ncbi:cation diffusion facilitator family transporter [Methanobacterium sp.]|uniref:cation diffusion facilitator family transporter n=1 Tax=Methanobacterium sp. TaxID=2164 RepID=UPI003C76CC2E
MNTVEREKRGKKAIIVGISGNIILVIFNFIVGTLSGSTALVAEAAHTFSDILDSSIAFIGFKIGLKPPDIEHPYGYGRAESLAGLVSVIFLIIIAYEILSDVYQKLLLGGALTPPDWIAAVMALVSVGINFTMTTYMAKTGREINSPAIIADSKHQKVDVFTSIAIFLGIAGSQFVFPILDPLVALFIVVLVLRTAFEIARDNINNILGKLPSEDLVTDIKKEALSVDGTVGAHSIKVNYVGPYASVDIHVEVDPDLSVVEAHKISTKVEKRIIEHVDIVTIVNVHVCITGEKGVCLD